jgi:hypothetical protein
VKRPADEIIPEEILAAWLEQAPEMSKRDFVRVRGYEIGVIVQELETLLEMVECALERPREWNRYKAFVKRQNR